MTAKEFLDKCTPDCKERIKIFLIFMNNIVDGRNLKDDFQILDIDNNICIDSGGDITVFYLIYILFYTKVDIAEILKQKGFDIEKYFRISSKIKEELDLITSEFKNIPMSEFELCFNDKSWAKIVLKTFTSNIEANNICLERIFINLTDIINRILNLKDVLQNSDALKQI